MMSASDGGGGHGKEDVVRGVAWIFSIKQLQMCVDKGGEGLKNQHFVDIMKAKTKLQELFGKGQVPSLLNRWMWPRKKVSSLHMFLQLWSPSSSMRWQCSSSEEKKEPEFTRWSSTTVLSTSSTACMTLSCNPHGVPWARPSSAGMGSLLGYLGYLRKPLAHRMPYFSVLRMLKYRW